MLLNEKEKQIKDIRRKIDRIRELHLLIRNAGYIKLDKPEFYGWKKYYDLKEEVSDIPYYKKLLNLVYNEVISTNKEFKRKRFFSKEDYYLELEPKSFTENEFDKVVPEQFRNEFRLELVTTSYWGMYSTERYIWKLIDPWYLEEKVKKHYITEKRLLVPEAESELEKLTEEVYQNKMNLVKKLKSPKKSDWDMFDEKREDNFEKRQEEKAVIDELLELDIDLENARIDL